MVVEEKEQPMHEEPIILANEQVTVTTSSNGPITDVNTSIIKGKRTKRQRPQSPISFCLNLNAGENSNNNDDNNIENNDDNNNNAPESEESRSDLCINVQDANYTNANTSILLSDDSHSYKTKEEEEEEEYDIANCLILLAQGLPRYLCENSNNNDDQYYNKPAPDQKKFTSKKFMETPYGDKAGYYVYECKTCFKTFPSFQALGGHRASHMKPKKEEERTNNFIVNDNQSIYGYNDDHYNHNANNNINNYNNYNNFNNNNNIQANLYSTSNINTTTNNNNNKKPRIHECSTCGAEFLSGQALGGHMRRHRAPLGARMDNVNGGSRHNHNENYFNPELQSSLSFKTSMMVNASHTSDNNLGKAPLVVEAKKLCLNLDLNLAAPAEDESSKIQLGTKE